MRFSAEKLAALRKAQGLPLKDVLEKAGVSKTAYYHLVNRDSILPRSVTAIAAALGVRASELLEEDASAPEKVRRIALLAERLAARKPRPQGGSS